MKTFYSLILASLIVLSSINASGFLTTQGKKIVDADGTEILFKGMGLGGWLVPEGYMLHTSPAGNSPSEIRALVVDLIGENDANIFFQNYRSNYVKRTDIRKLAEWGFNTIRLPMHYDLLTPRDQPGVYLEEGFALIDSLLAWCKESNIYLILDMHCAPGGQSDENISDYDPNFPSLWEDPANKTRTVNIWKEIATRYVNEEWIAGYDLLNEPKWNLPPNNQPLRDLYIDITNAIREVDTNHILFIEGNWYATDFSGLTPPWDSKLVYSFHKYWNNTDQGTIQYLVDIRNNHNVPLWLGETGENSNVWFTNCIDLMKQNNIGWTWWPHKKFESIAVPLSAPISSHYQQILNYWNGSASRPSVGFAKTALNIMAADLEFSNCTFRPDVIDAMFRQTQSTESIPFKTLSAPGIIYAVDFDMGRKGFAYQDNDYQNVNGNGGGAWNSGWQYRNDAVDIEECTDNITNGFNVGWVENGEWMKYTINVNNSGTYNIKLRTASQSGGGLVKFIIDGQAINNLISIGSTGGWQNWQDFTIENIELVAGVSELTLQAVLGGFNVNYIEFVPISITDTIDETTPPDEFVLYQNYPNPFNGGTQIKVFVPFESEVTVKIFDIDGQQVETLARKDLVSGTKIYLWNPTANSSISSGVYFVNAVLGGKDFTKKIVYLK